jgi:hypothetical protein
MPPEVMHMLVSIVSTVRAVNVADVIRDHIQIYDKRLEESNVCAVSTEYKVDGADNNLILRGEIGGNEGIYTYTYICIYVYIYMYTYSYIYIYI